MKTYTQLVRKNNLYILRQFIIYTWSRNHIGNTISRKPSVPTSLDSLIPEVGWISSIVDQFAHDTLMTSKLGKFLLNQFTY